MPLTDLFKVFKSYAAMLFNSMFDDVLGAFVKPTIRHYDSFMKFKDFDSSEIQMNIKRNQKKTK